MKSKFNFAISLKLVSIDVEIRALQDGYELISRTIGSLQDSEVSRLGDTLALDTTLDQEDKISLHDDVHYTIEVVYPRLFWGPFLISVYSVFESSLIELSELLREELECELKIDELNGDLLEKAKCYFSKILKLRIKTESPCWEAITRLRTVRNCFAHSNGRVGYKLQDNNKVNQILKKNIGVTHQLDVLIVNQKFVKESLDAVVKFIKEWQAEYGAIWNRNRQSEHGCKPEGP